MLIAPAPMAECEGILAADRTVSDSRSRFGARSVDHLQDRAITQAGRFGHLGLHPHLLDLREDVLGGVRPGAADRFLKLVMRDVILPRPPAEPHP